MKKLVIIIISILIYSCTNISKIDGLLDEVEVLRDNYGINHIMNRDGVYYYIRRVPCDLSDFYAIKRLFYSLKTKSINTARRLSRSI